MKMLSCRKTCLALLLSLVFLFACCGMAAAEAYPESAHPYANKTDKSWTYQHPVRALSLSITFSSSTKVESDCDFIYIISEDGTEQKFTGTELRSQTITVPGSSFIIRLTSDGSETAYGFSITDITAEVVDYGFTIEDGVMISCSNAVGDVYVPEDVTQIGNNAFENCTEMTGIILPEGVTSIGNYAFRGCTALTAITLPNSVTSIGSSAFMECSALTSAVLGSNVTDLGSYAFSNCNSLTSFRIPSGVTRIPDCCFYFCSELTEVIIPSSVTGIVKKAFMGTGLTEIYLPRDITFCDIEAFSGTTTRYCLAGSTTAATLSAKGIAYTALNAYEINSAGTNRVDVLIYGDVDSAVYAEIKTACGSKTINSIKIMTGATFDVGSENITAATVTNYGTISSGTFNGNLINYAEINGACTINNVINHAGATISGSYDREDGWIYFDTYINGTIENYGAISSVGYGSSASVLVNEGTLQTKLRYNSGWDWDEGWGWETSDMFVEYGASVGETLGWGWYLPSGEYAYDKTFGLQNTLYKQWSVSADGVMTVEAYGSSQSAPVQITAAMTTGVSKIVVLMGYIASDNLTVPVELKWRVCESDSHYYTANIVSGKYKDVTVSQTASILGGQITGTLTLNKGCKIADSVTLGYSAKCIVNSLAEDINIWGPYISSYHLPMTVAENGSITVSRTFNGDITNYGTISSGTYYGKVSNHGTITGGSFYGAFAEYGEHTHAPAAGGNSVSWTRWDGSSKLSLTSGDNYIALTGDITPSSQIVVSSGQTLHLCLAGGDLISSYSGYCISVESGGTLILCDCAASDGKITHASGIDGGGVYVYDGGLFEMYGGKISDNVSYGDGIGVYCYGTFVMHDGEISGNNEGSRDFAYGAGVKCNYSTGSFIMNGGRITGNKSNSGGGVCVSNGASFTMNGGTISGNTANTHGGGIYGNSIKVTINGGTITGNTAQYGGGIYGYTVTLSGNPTISGNTLTDGTTSNLNGEYNFKILLKGDFSGNVYVSPKTPASGSHTVFLERTDGELTADDLKCFQPDNSTYKLYINENGQGVLGQKTYALSLTNAKTADGKTSASVAPGTELGISAVVPEGKVFIQWQNGAGDILDIAEPTFTTVMPINDLTLTAVLVDEFVIIDGVLTAYHGENKPLITIPEDITSIAEGVFDHCSMLETVILPSAMTNGFVDTLPAGVDKFFVYSGKTLTKYIGSKTEVTLPECVTRIEGAASMFPACVTSVTGPAVTHAYFNSHDTIEYISLPLIEEIPGSAFDDLKNLRQINLPKAKTIGSSAFYGLDHLESIALPNAVNIGDYAFGSCDQLESVSIPNVTMIGTSAFTSCIRLTDISAPELTSIGESAFENCAALERAYFPKLKDIPKRVFDSCQKLHTFEHDVSAPYVIGESAFMLTGLTTIDLTNATAIETCAFFGSKLASVLVPDTVTSIGSLAFNSSTIIRSSLNAYARTWAQESGNPWEHDVHNETVLAAVAPTCTTDGLTEGLWCPECEAILTEQVVIPAPGHSYGEPDFAWTHDGSACTVTFTCQTCGDAQTPEAVITYEITLQPDCVNMGETTYTASVTFGEEETVNPENPEETILQPKAYTDQLTLADLPALGHEEVILPGFAPTCTNPGLTDYIYCEVCEEELQIEEEIPALGHTEAVTLARLEPTCTEDGHTEEISCSVCLSILVTSDAIPAMGHAEYVSADSVAPDCTNTGLTEEISCSTCGEVLTPAAIVPALGHTPEADEAVAPDCVNTGLTEGSHCAVCSAVITAQEVIPALGHSAVTDEAVPPTDYETGLTEGSHCAVCSAVLTAQEIVPANFTWDGTTAIAYNGTATDVVIPDSTTALGDALFKNNAAITSVRVPDSVIALGTHTFYGCSALTDVWLPGHLTSIGPRTFQNTAATVHASAESATAVALSYRRVPFTTADGYTLLYSVTSLTGTPSAVWLISYHGDSVRLILPETMGGIALTQIGANAFDGCSQLSMLVVSKGVTAIGDDAFSGCPEATVWVYPNSAAHTYVVSKGDIPFGVIGAHNPADNALTLPSGLKTIQKEAFAGLTVSEIVIPDGCETIAERAFADCASLAYAVIPSTVTEIAPDAFAGCDGLSIVAPVGSAAYDHAAAYGFAWIPD